MTRQMADDEVLRPCPFCGGEPVLEAEVIHFPGKPRNKFFAVKCVSENCPASNIAQDGEMGGFICSWRKEKAIAAWNDQRSVAALQAERDALRDGHESAKKSIKLGQDLVTAMANAMHEAGATFDMGTLKVVNTRAERAESALEALRGQVAGLVEALSELADAGEDAWGAERPCVRAARAELLAIKERMDDGNR